MTSLIADGPHFEWMISFLAVVRCEGYTTAARYLDVPQPNVSKHVARLEAWFGHDLLTKNRPPKLTPEGRKAIKVIEDFAKRLCILSGNLPTYGTGTPWTKEQTAINNLLFPATVV